MISDEHKPDIETLFRLAALIPTMYGDVGTTVVLQRYSPLFTAVS